MPRRKPIPAPIVRPQELGLPARPLAPVRTRVALPTAAALLAAMATLGCEAKREAIRDDVPTVQVIPTAAPRGSEPLADPLTPLPGMGALEGKAPDPEPVPTTLPTVIPPPIKPYPVKGGAKAVHPMPKAPAMPGGPKPATTAPIPPAPKPPMLGGDMPAVMPIGAPETT